MSDYEFDEFDPEHDHEEGHLCEHHPLDKIMNRFLKAGLPPERLPSIEAVVSRLIEFCDERKLTGWINAYLKLEMPPKIAEDE